MSSTDAALASDPETWRIIKDPGHGFLGNLCAPAFQRYPYRGRVQFEDNFERAYEATSDDSEWFIVSSVNAETFSTEFLEAEEPPFSLWCAYDPTLELALVRMVNSIGHETAAGTFGNILQEALIPTGMHRCLKSNESTPYHANVADFGRKQPDKAWKPARLPPDRSHKWPTAVLEVAYSESSSKLQSDLRWWMRAPEGEVKTILTMRVSRNEPSIIVERWESNDNGRSNCQQQVIISRRGNQNIITTGAPLVLYFERLFLRAPTVPRGRDIEIDTEKLEYLAESVWSEQGF